MLQAINLLGGMYATPSKASSPPTPLTPTSTTPSRIRSPYFRKLDHGISTPGDNDSPQSNKRHKYDLSDNARSSTPRRSKRLKDKVVSLPPTPESLPRKEIVKPEPERKLIRTPSKSSTVSTSGRNKKKRQKLDSPLETDSKSRSRAKTVLGQGETGEVECIGKIHLIQEKLRYEPWKMLVAVTLLNKTSGRAANPIREEIFERWPTPQSLSEASQPDLAEVLYPLGLFNQRANSLIRLSQQYIQLGWPLTPLSRHTNLDRYRSRGRGRGRGGDGDEECLPDNLDVKVFFGAGIYASDSFRIYSPLFAGRGGPEEEGKGVMKRERAIQRRQVMRSSEGDDSDLVGVEEIGAWLSDDDDDDEVEEEWRKVLPTDKELRRYLVWRWGLEGIVYDIHKGPQIKRERDRRRLSYLVDTGVGNDT